MNTYFTYIPKELVYEIGYYSSTDDILELSEITGYFDEYYFWENYITYLGYLFIKPFRNMNTVQHYINWEDAMVMSNERVERVCLYGSLHLDKVPSHVLFRLDLSELTNLSEKYYNVEIICNGQSKYYLEIRIPMRFSLNIDISKEDVFRLFVYYKDYKINIL